MLLLWKLFYCWCCGFIIHKQYTCLTQLVITTYLRFVLCYSSKRGVPSESRHWCGCWTHAISSIILKCISFLNFNLIFNFNYLQLNFLEKLNWSIHSSIIGFLYCWDLWVLNDDKETLFDRIEEFVVAYLWTYQK